MVAVGCGIELTAGWAMAVIVGVARETAAGERRVALSPETCKKLVAAGATVEECDDAVRVTRSGPLKKINLKTLPHPGFPTDLQPQMAVMLSVAEGTSIITEGVWDNRYKYVDELRRMGAKIQVDGKVAVVTGAASGMGKAISKKSTNEYMAMI